MFSQFSRTRQTFGWAVILGFASVVASPVRAGDSELARYHTAEIMCTVGHRKNGVMDEEYLFRDNQTYMKQIGLGQ
jgi:hypothetical protein